MRFSLEIIRASASIYKPIAMRSNTGLTLMTVNENKDDLIRLSFIALLPMRTKYRFFFKFCTIAYGDKNTALLPFSNTTVVTCSLRQNTVVRKKLCIAFLRKTKRCVIIFHQR